MSTKKTDARTASKPTETPEEIAELRARFEAAKAKHAETPAAAEAKPKQQRQHELTEFQRHICELAGDIIVNGGDDTDVTNLLLAVAGHEYRRIFPAATSAAIPWSFLRTPPARWPTT